MTFLEKELEDLLFEMLKDPVKLTMERNFYCLGMLEWRRQVNLKKYGIADIVGIKIETLEDEQKTKVTIHVIELKRDVINYATLGQASRYMSAIIKEVYEKINNEHEIKIDANISLVGSSIDMAGDFCFMLDTCQNLRIYKANFHPYKGLLFEKLGNYYFKDSQTNCLQGITPTELPHISIFYE